MQRAFISLDLQSEIPGAIPSGDAHQASVQKTDLPAEQALDRSGNELVKYNSPADFVKSTQRNLRKATFLRSETPI
jgi:hypothetical protein